MAKEIKLPFSDEVGYINQTSFPSGDIDITENGEYDVYQYAKANVNVSGGGSSDFSTAKVTLQPVAGDSFLGASAATYLDYFLNEEKGYSCTDFRILASVETEILLYKEEATLTINTVFDESTQPVSSPGFAVVSGDAVQDEQYKDTFHISGDCVISVATK